MNLSLNYVVAKRAMAMIAAQGTMGHLDVIGLSREDFTRVTGAVPWLGTDRNRITVALNTLLSGVLDAAGVPRFALPAEWVAAAIAVFVSPINIHLACSYVERPGTASDLGRGVEEFDRCTAQQLFALIVQFYGSDAHVEARRQFEAKTQLKLDQLESADPEKGSKNGKK